MLFVVGSLAGRFIQPSPVSESALPSVATVNQSSLAESATSEVDAANLDGFDNWLTEPGNDNYLDSAPTTDAGDQGEIITASYEESGPARADTDQLPHVVRTIERYFPEMDAESVAIWAEQYASTPIEELEFLLEQKKLMGGFESSAFLNELNAVSDQIGLSETHSAIVERTASELAEFNIQNLLRPGYRQQLLLPSGDLTDSQSAPVFDFSPGRSIVTGQPLHLMIQDGPSYMFRLEPGNRVTRCGRFERMGDGRLAVRAAGELIPLYESPVIPTDPDTLRVANTGQTFQDTTDGIAELPGPIPIVMIRSLGRLTSSDGVIFEVDEPAEVLTQHEPSLLIQGQLELSNVDERLQQ
jgi:hypothetical protein